MSQVVLPNHRQSRDVVHHLIQHIKSESLAVGDRLPSIRQLAAKMSLSPNVIRNAMVQAQTMGLVELRPRSGAYIRSLDYAPLVDVMSQAVLPDQQQSQDVVRRLIQHIKSESLAVGDRLPAIRQLAAKMSLSPNVVRDAMVQAQTMGLVELRPRSGVYIRSLDYAPLVDVLTDTLVTSLMQTDHSLFYLLESRELMEVELVGQAARRRRLEDLLPVREALDIMTNLNTMTKATNQVDQSTKFVDADVAFHLEIARIAGNPVLLAFLKAVLELLRPYLVSIHKSFNPELREWTDHSHAAIYDALVEGDIELARREIHEHVSMAARNLVEKENNSMPSDSGSKSEGTVE